MRILFCLLTLVSLTSCYRMPNEKEYSVLPSTNNPQVIRQRGNPSWIPQGKF